jgi:HK97 family phage prohead protease/HK97 family phage major capsid protein
MSHLLVRDMRLRADIDGKREFTGIAVPWNQPARVHDWWEGTYDEEIERGAVQDSDEAMIFWRHAEPVGKIISARDTDEGWEITAHLSETERGNEAYTLLRDGVIDRMSIGFEPIEHREVSPPKPGDTKKIIRSKIKVREVSLVPFPAYDGAKVSTVRSESTPVPSPAPAKEKAMDEDLKAIREALDDHSRALDLIRTTQERSTPTPALSTPSAGHFLKAAIRGDQSAIDELQAVRAAAIERAYDGATTGDSVLTNSWVGDLTRLVEQADPLRDIFSTGPLPADGNTLEYAQLKANTVTVTEQAAEGDDLASGKVEIETKTATVKTYGGYTELTRQSIERSSINYLNHAMRAMALAAGLRKTLNLRAEFATARAAQVTASNTVTVADGDDYTSWVSAIVDAAVKYEDLGLPLDRLVTSTGIFKRLASLTDTAGRPLMRVQDDGANSIGQINAKALNGQLANVEVRLNAKQAAEGATFTTPLAIRSYTSPLVNLQDGNLINLTQSFSVYYYGAIAQEIPAGIIPVTITA